MDSSLRLYVLRTRTLGALSIDVRNELTLLEIIERHAFDGGHVKKQVLAFAGADEAKPAVSFSFDCAFRHVGPTFFYFAPCPVGAEW
jgi:hypothetical protein